MTANILEKAFQIQKEAMDRTADFFNKSVKLSNMMQNPPVVETGMTPSEVIFRRHRTRLLHYRPVREQVYQTPILIVYAMVNKPYVLDLIPGKSVVEFLLNEGFDVYLLDWGTPTTIDNNKGLEVYINDYLDSCVDRILDETGLSALTIMGYCMGGTMSLMFASLHPEKVKNLVTMATPFDFTEDDGMLYKWSKEFPFDELVETYGACPGWYLNLSFAAIKPMGSLDKVKTFYDKLLDEKFMKLFLAMEKWSADSKPVPGKAYLEFVQGCFQQNLMVQNKFKVGDQAVDLKKINCSFLNLVGEQDTLVPPSSSDKIGDYLSGDDKELIRCNTGHIGLSVSGKALKQMWPAASRWLSERSGGKSEVC